MRGGVHWRGSNRARRREQECNPNQSPVLRSGDQDCRRGASVLAGFFILCIVAWTLLRFRTPSPISTESLPRQAPSRAVVFELFRYYRQSPARNDTFSVLAGPVHRRRRGLLGHLGFTASTGQEIFSEEEQAEQPCYGQRFGGNVGISSLRRRGRKDRDSMTCHHGASSSAGGASTTRPPLKKWRVLGGYRSSDQEMDALYTKLELGNRGTGRMREYIVTVDSGSAQTWVNCLGSPVVGPGGLFEPSADSYLNCETSPDMCSNFQDGDNINQPCDLEHNFRCLYTYTYGDGTICGGSVINADIGLDLSDGSRERRTIAIGCSNDRRDESDPNNNPNPGPPSPEDGLLGIGRHAAGLLSQLHSLNLFSEYVFAICLEPVHPRVPPGPMEYAGFFSLGNLYTSLAATTVWTASIVPRGHETLIRPQDIDAMYTALLVEVVYRDKVINLVSKKRSRDGNVGDSTEAIEAQMGFDTASDLTYLGSRLFNRVQTFLDEDARSMGYRHCQDAPERLRKSWSRKCWFDPRDARKSLVQTFGNLILKFASLANDGTTSDLVIKPEYYITANRQAPDNSALRTCFNMREEGDFLYGNVGAEAMRGHLFIFNERPHQIGWSPVTSCSNLR